MSFLELIITAERNQTNTMRKLNKQTVSVLCVIKKLLQSLKPAFEFESKTSLCQEIVCKINSARSQKSDLDWKHDVVRCAVNHCNLEFKLLVKCKKNEQRNASKN